MEIKEVIIFTNGNVLCYDNEGKQMPMFQGFIFDVAEKLKENCDKDTKFMFMRYATGEILECKFDWWFKE